MLVVGAGLSFGVAPLPIELVRNQLGNAEIELGIEPVEGVPDDPSGLYFWAERALEQLEGQDTPIPPKLRLAKALGVLSNERWFGQLDLYATSPKHRILARFAMDQKLDEIWSLNWDCHLENAMESIGFCKGGNRKGVAWTTSYNSIVTNQDFEEARSNHQSLKILKPHGCINSMQAAERNLSEGDVASAQLKAERFMITDDELHNKRENDLDDRFDAHVRNSIQEKFLVMVGWSISEGNWREILNEGNRLRGGASQLGDLSIIDPFFSIGHDQAALVFGTERRNVHFEISTDPAAIDANRFFLWLQACYCLDQMKRAAEQFDSDEVTKALDAIASTLDRITIEHFLYDWADAFLPEWIRICWRGGALSGAPVSEDFLDHHNKHEHIPLNVFALNRPDLFYAARLLICVYNTQIFTDIKSFPACFYDLTSCELIVPIPMWCNDFKALAALNATWARHNLGLVQSIKLVPLATDGTHLSANQIDQMKYKFCSAISHPYFANPENIGIATEFADALGVTHD